MSLRNILELPRRCNRYISSNKLVCMELVLVMLLLSPAVLQAVERQQEERERLEYASFDEYLMSLAAGHDPDHHGHSQLSDFNRNTSSSTEFNNTKIPLTIYLHVNNGSSSSQEESYQADEAASPETGFLANETGDAERLHDTKHVPETNDEKKPDTAAATSSASIVSYPIILHTLLDDEDMFVGSGVQASAQMEDEQEVELKPEVVEPEDWAPEGDDQVDDDDDDDNEKYEVIENTSDILGYFKDVPRKHWSCCMLGKLAGEKGFHCHAAFYAARISARNSNRAHNNKMLFHGKNPNPHWGMDIMVTFERCIANHANEFHKCCYASAIEKKERYKWHYYRQQKELTGSSKQEESLDRRITDKDIAIPHQPTREEFRSSQQEASTSLGSGMPHEPEVLAGSWTPEVPTGSRSLVSAEISRTQTIEQRNEETKGKSSKYRRRHRHGRRRRT